MLPKLSSNINSLLKELNEENNKTINDYFIKDLNELIINYDILDNKTRLILEENLKMLETKLKGMVKEQEEYDNSMELKISASTMNKLLKEDIYVKN